MKISIFSAKPHDRQSFDAANGGRHELRYLEARLTSASAELAKGSGAVCLFAAFRPLRTITDARRRRKLPPSPAPHPEP